VTANNDLNNVWRLKHTFGLLLHKSIDIKIKAIFAIPVEIYA